MAGIATKQKKHRKAACGRVKMYPLPLAKWGTWTATANPGPISRRLDGRPDCYVQPSTPSLHSTSGFLASTVLRNPRSALVVDSSGCSMSATEVSLWWGQNRDLVGNLIRPDVEAAAHLIWARASRRAESLIRDSSQAAELMEVAVAQVSRYLDRGKVPLFSRKLEGLLMLAFCRVLDRYASRLRKIETAGSADLSCQAVDRTWSRQLDARVELAQVVRLLSGRSQIILSLRYAGYTWRESADLLGVSVSALRNAFWRDVGRVKRLLQTEKKVPSVAQTVPDSLTNDSNC